MGPDQSLTDWAQSSQTTPKLLLANENASSPRDEAPVAMEEEEESSAMDPLDPRHETEMKQAVGSYESELTRDDKFHLCVDGEDAAFSDHSGNGSLGRRMVQSAWEAVWQNVFCG
jgi:hypothetical protein